MGNEVSSPADVDRIDDWEVIPRRKSVGPVRSRQSTPKPTASARTKVAVSPVLSPNQAERMQGGFFDDGTAPWREGQDAQQNENAPGSGARMAKSAKNSSGTSQPRPPRTPLSCLQPLETSQAAAAQTSSPALRQQARLVTVGARVQSHEHFHKWLDSPCDQVGKARSPGKHYTSMGRRPVSHESKVSGLWSEGNRFIIDKDL